MTEWGLALQTYGEIELAEQVNESKLASLARLTELDLPAPRFVSTGVTDFLAAPEACFEALVLPHYFGILSPHNTELQRYRQAQLDKNDVETFIRSTLAPHNYKEYDLILQEAFNYLYGGNIVCTKEGEVEVELVAGQRGHNLLVTGRATPEYTARRDQYTDRFVYSFDDPELRRALWRTILAIPHTYSGDHATEYRDRGLQFRPGYYEFYLASKAPDSTNPEQESLQPVFIDTSDQPAFLPVSNPL